MRLDPYGFSRLFRLLLRFIYICSIFSISYAQNEVEEPTEAPDTFQYRTGKLNQFKGFYTPRPFMPSNMDFSYGSIWATWSAWSFCANGVQVRVRACNTERRPCGAPQPRTKFEPALHEQDYDAVDPYIEDRREAMKQLYSDYEVPKLIAPPKNPRRKPARRPISVGAPDSDFTIQSPDGKRNFHVVNPIASGIKTSCGYGNCNQGLAPPPRAPSSVDVKSNNKYQAPSLTPDQVYGKTKNPYEENPSGTKKSKKKHKIRGEKTQDIKEQEILKHLEVVENHIEETTTTATTKAEQLGNVEVAINVGRQKPSKPTSTEQEETDYFNGPDQNIDYEEDYGKGNKESIEKTLDKNTNVEENEETEITKTTEETTFFTYPPTIRLKLVTAPPKESKLRSLKKHRNEEVNKNVITEIKETTAIPLTRATTQKPHSHESSTLPTTTPPTQTHKPSPKARHPEIVEPKITYTSNFSAMPYPEMFPKSEQNHIVSAVPLPPMFEIEGPMIELTGNTPFEEDKDDTHDVEISSEKQKSDAKIDKNEENHETTVTTESPKEREIIPNSEKMMIEGPVPGEEVLEVEKEAKKSSVTQQVRKNVHAGEVKFGKEIITEDTAKAIEWLLSNMTEAAKKQEQQLLNTQTQSKNSFNQKVNEELAAKIEAINKNDASKKEVLHSGEVIIPNLHRTNSGESKPRFLTRLHGTKIFKTTDKVVKIHEDEMENDGAHIFTHLTTTLNDKSVPENTKIEKSEHNLDETIATKSSPSLSDTPRTTEAPRLPNHDGQLQYHTFRKKPTATKLIFPNIEATTETILQKPQETIYVSAETNDTKNIEVEILRLQKEMKEMESELNDLKNQEDSIQDEMSQDEKVEEVTKIYPVINPKAYNLNLVPTGPKSESGPLPPIISRENSETFILGDMDMSEKLDAQWNEWSDWAECFCNKQVRTRSCNYESGYHSKGCVGKSYETRNCISIKPCPSVHLKKIKLFTSTLSPSSTFYTLAPPGRRRLGANFMMNQLSIAKLSKPLRSKSSSLHAMTVRKFFHT